MDGKLENWDTQKFSPKDHTIVIKEGSDTLHKLRTPDNTPAHKVKFYNSRYLELSLQKLSICWKAHI